MGSETELRQSYPPPRALWLSVQKKKGKGDRKGDWGPSACPIPLGACAVRCGVSSARVRKEQGALWVTWTNPVSSSPAPD